jgi:kinesin family protein 5
VQYTSSNIKISLSGKVEENHEFAFDAIWGPEVSQSRLYELAAKPVVAGIHQGYNGTLFTYSQTGSGKTFTMEGADIHDTEMRGVITRMMHGIFEGFVEASDNCKFAVVPFLEIYMERIQNLIDASKSNLQVKGGEDQGHLCPRRY